MVPVSGYDIFTVVVAMHVMGLVYFFPHLEVAEFGVFRVKKSVLLQGGLDIWNSTSQVLKPRKEVESRPFASWLRKGNGPEFIIWFRVEHVAKLSICWFELTDFHDYVFLCWSFWKRKLKDEKSPIFRFRGRLWTLRDFALQHSNWDSFTDKGKLRVWLPDLKKTPSEHDSWVIKNKLSVVLSKEPGWVVPLLFVDLSLAWIPHVPFLIYCTAVTRRLGKSWYQAETS